MRALDGKSIDGTTVIGRGLPVSFRNLKARIAALVEEVAPAGVISIGLWPGEPMIRLERIGVNVADFEIADNDGEIVRDDHVSANGAAGRLATLPLREIERAMLAEGIPVRLSSTAGTFLCNTCLYSLLEAAEGQARHVPCGFMHVPYMPEQVGAIGRHAQAGADRDASAGRSSVDGHRDQPPGGRNRNRRDDAGRRLGGGSGAAITGEEEGRGNRERHEDQQAHQRVEHRRQADLLVGRPDIGLHRVARPWTMRCARSR